MMYMRAVVSAVGCMPLLGGRWISPADSPTIPNEDFTQQFELLALVVFYIIAEIHRGARVIIRLVCRSMIGQATDYCADGIDPRRREIAGLLSQELPQLDPFTDNDLGRGETFGISFG
jgi:hypothetical protein